MIIRYSPEFDGYFTLLDYCLKADIARADFLCERPWIMGISQMDLFSCAETTPEFAAASIRLFPRRDSAEAFLSRLRRAAPSAEEEIHFAFLSEEPIEPSLIEYSKIALSGDRPRLENESDLAVRTVLRAARRVRREIHAFQGLLRFDETASGCFEAKFEPDADIARALNPFFTARFGSFPYRIIDLKRGRIVGTPIRNDGGSHPDNRECVDLWRTFYASTENPQRLNPKLRLQHVPKRYWNHLPELEGKDS